ncbi:MAG: hypothetical protein MJ252_19195 [archaeon]|nr:hypothetical protein [archaeon]
MNKKNYLKECYTIEQGLEFTTRLNKFCREDNSIYTPITGIFNKGKIGTLLKIQKISFTKIIKKYFMSNYISSIKKVNPKSAPAKNPLNNEIKKKKEEEEGIDKNKKTIKKEDLDKTNKNKPNLNPNINNIKPINTKDENLFRQNKADKKKIYERSLSDASKNIFKSKEKAAVLVNALNKDNPCKILAPNLHSSNTKLPSKLTAKQKSKETKENKRKSSEESKRQSNFSNHRNIHLSNSSSKEKDEVRSNSAKSIRGRNMISRTNRSPHGSMHSNRTYYNSVFNFNVDSKVLNKYSNDFNNYLNENMAINLPVDKSSGENRKYTRGSQATKSSQRNSSEKSTNKTGRNTNNYKIDIKEIARNSLKESEYWKIPYEDI